MSGDLSSLGPVAASGVEEQDIRSPGGDVARLDQIASELSAVDTALRRLDEGTYGTCQVCGEPLDVGRLDEQPALARCPVHT